MCNDALELFIFSGLRREELHGQDASTLAELDKFIAVLRALTAKIMDSVVFVVSEICAATP